MTSNDSMKEIEVILKQVKELVNNLVENVSHTGIIFQNQAAAIEEITANIQELASLSVVLEEMSGKF